jgi:hypothetical protein
MNAHLTQSNEIEMLSLKTSCNFPIRSSSSRERDEMLSDEDIVSE